jgi:hypothetical protein
MTGRRFIGLGSESFLGELVYGRAVQDIHFLMHLYRVVQRGVFSQRLIRLHEGQAQERSISSGGHVLGPELRP